MTPAERARQIDEEERRAESAALLKRALTYSATKRQAEASRIAAWLGRDDQPIQHKIPVGRPAKLYIHNGMAKTLTEWSQIAGVSYQVFAQRIHSGMDFEKAVTMKPRQKSELHSINGVSKTYTQWADYAGCTYNTLIARMRRHSLAEAIAMSRPLPTPGVVSNLGGSLGTGGGSTAQETPNIDFSQDATA